MSATRPTNLLIYYGYLNSFNSAVNGWNNENVAIDMATYDICVFGSSVANPVHPDYVNTQIILARLRTIKPEIQIYGYVQCSQLFTNFQTEVNQWDALAVDGIFIDEAGYDYGTTRDQFNERVVHIRSKIHARKCFVNAWNMDHIIGTTEDPGYSNSTFNPNLHVSLLDKNDFYLLESFSVNTVAYGGNNGYAAKADVLARGNKAIVHNKDYGIKIAVVGIINNDNLAGQQLFNFNYHSAILIGADVVGSSDVSYGSNSATVKFWNRQGTKQIGKTDEIIIAESLVDADVCVRFGDYSKVLLDFSTGAQISLISSW